MTAPTPPLSDSALLFLKTAHRAGALCFGTFTLKSTRISPYFFNAGAFNTGELIERVCTAYALGIEEKKLAAQCDVLFGPAYKGIPLVVGTAMILAQKGHSLPYAFNRKACKSHGEGGELIGAPLSGQRVLLLDDVVTAGTAIGETVAILERVNANLGAVLVGLDRMEAGSNGGLSAVEDISQRYGVPVHALATLDDVLTYAEQTPTLQSHRPALDAYRARYGSHRLNAATPATVSP